VDLAGANKERTQRLVDDGALARRDLDAAVRDLSVAAAQLRTAQEQLRLMQQRYQPEEIQIARDDVRQAELALALARADVGRMASKERELAAARQSVRAAEAALKIAQTSLSYATITAPIGGVVASVSTQQGETVTAGAPSGEAPTFVTIVDLLRLEAHSLVDETDIGKVRTGQAVTFTVATFPDHEFTGKVTAIYPRALVEQNVVTYDVVIAIGTPGDALRPDMTVTATIIVAERPQVLAVPNQAVRRVDGRRVVYVQQGEQFAPRVVKIGWRDKTYTEILNGLREGERVLISEPTNASRQVPDASPGKK